MKHFLFQNLVFLVTVCSCTKGLRMYVQPKEFYAFDKNIKLICAASNQTADGIIKFQTLKIEKLTRSNRWTPVADIHYDGKINDYDFGAVTNGFIGKPPETFLAVTWNVATPGKFGKYRCEAFGESASGGFMTQKSDLLDIKSVSRLTSELFDLIRSLDQSVIDKIHEVSFRLHILEENQESFFNSRRVQLQVLEDEMDIIESLLKTQIQRSLSSVEASITALESIAKIPEWPEGDFTLLSPSTGCPFGVPEMGMIKIPLANRSSHDRRYAPHMTFHAESANFFQYFCSTRASRKSQQSWPVGSYCINQHTTSCPKGFVSSSITYDLPNGEDLVTYGSIPIGDYTTADKMDIYFCCRHDGDPTNAVSLPMSRPFYLYRHNGRCQKVIGMDVATENFKLETSNDDGGDQWNDSPVEDRPDFQIRPVVGELCFYHLKDSF